MKLIITFISVLSLVACDLQQAPTTTNTQMAKAQPKIKKTAEGLTLEQENIREYRQAFSDPKAIKHLYVFNDQGQCIFYDTVRGKVTSGGKRLRPKTVAATDGQYVGERHYGISVQIDGRWHRTGEVPSFDGTFGSSESYIYWRNSAGQFRKLSLGAGMSTITTTSPLRLIEAVVNMATLDEEDK